MTWLMQQLFPLRWIVDSSRAIVIEFVVASSAESY